MVDASVALKWVVPEPDSDLALELLQSGAALLAPSHWIGEVATGLWAKASMRAELTREQAERRLDFLLGLNIAETSARALAPLAFAQALELGVTPYDMLYLTLAQREDAPFVTADRKLVQRVKASARHAPLIIPLSEVASRLAP